MISQERFNEIEATHGCGYWNVCWEHACPCAITTENKGLQESIYNSLLEEGRRVAEEFEDEFNSYDFDGEEETEEYCFEYGGTCNNCGDCFQED